MSPRHRGRGAAAEWRALLATTLLAIPLLAAAPAAAAELEVPFLSGRVVDEAELVPPEAEARISQRLAAYEAETGTQIAVLTIPSLQGEPLEDYSVRVAETWQLGRGDVDDGVLLLVARDDRQMRLEVGYGLEPRLTDLASRRILDEVVRPRFRSGDFAGGIEAGTEAVVSVLRDGEDALPQPVSEPLGEDLPGLARVGLFLLFLLFLMPFLPAAVAQKGCGGWFAALFLLPFFVVFPAALVHPLVGLVLGSLWLVAFVLLRLYYRRHPKPKWMRSAHRGGGGFFGGGWTGGGGGFSGGGFSGGGGSFGGGGASSSW